MLTRRGFLSGLAAADDPYGPWKRSPAYLFTAAQDGRYGTASAFIFRIKSAG